MSSYKEISTREKPLLPDRGFLILYAVDSRYFQELFAAEQRGGYSATANLMRKVLDIIGFWWN